MEPAPKPPLDLENLRLLLQNEPFPQVYMHKFVGVRSKRFLQAVAELERSRPDIQRVGQQSSSTGKYVSLTFEVRADTAEVILSLIRLTAELPDLKIIL